jgi:serine/threonine protein kinase
MDTGATVWEAAVKNAINNNNSSFESFGNYLFLKKLAEGGMAEVFLARPATQDGNGRVQVVKRILPHVASHSAFLNMFQREIRVIMGFNHPNIVQLHDFGSIGVQPYIAMEYIEGKSIKDIVLKFNARKEKIPISMTLSLIAQAAAGLNYAHTFVNKITGEELKAIHRDITPHNLIVSYDGNLKVIDFGIAKAATSMQEMTQTGVIKGKAAYFAPEQLAGQEVDARTDIFALGVVAWEMLTQQRLFAKPGDTEITAMSRVSNCEMHIVPPSSLNAEIPPEVDEIVLMALKKDPTERFGSAREFQVALRQVMIRHFPNSSYSDVGTLLSAIFSDEIIADRQKLRDLNMLAQHEIVGTTEDETRTTSMVADVSRMTKGQVRTTNTGTYNTASTQIGSDGTGLGVMDFRLSKIEKMMKQKASARHYIMLAIYIISLIALKVTENYNFNFDVSRSKKAAQTREVKRVVQSAQSAPTAQTDTGFMKKSTKVVRR